MRFLFITSFVLLISCAHQNQHGQLSNSTFYFKKGGSIKYHDHTWLQPFERDEQVTFLKQKAESREPLIVHTMVPLCDNAHQGIVPVSPSLGDGFNLKTNLYWATRHGMKKYFELKDEWISLNSNFIANDTILERAIFKRSFNGYSEVILICDAYRGDQMDACVKDYLNSLAGFHSDSVLIDSTWILCGDQADMLVFNGHNGLYEVYPDTIYAQHTRKKDAVVLACSSYWGFTPFIQNANCYPLVTTSSSMYPGATILDYIIEAWVQFKSGEEIRLAAAMAYHEMKNCGLNAADGLFVSGW
ncbi:MAG: hypothetical protein IPM74_01060 [Crocinitomicaceae bacterium]|nr:hypothetical protein [Crocinitomicaceae bacterium]MBK8924507.1 hypothetical protein [Crocinitomicaceae bacterium]